MEEEGPRTEPDIKDLGSLINKTFIGNQVNDNILAKLLAALNLKEESDMQNALNAAITSSTEHSDDGLIQSIKQIQRKYISVSLFASLSYVYIKNMLTDFQVKINQLNNVTDLKIQALETQSATSQKDFEELKNKINELKSQQESYEQLEQLLKEKAEGLSQFVNQFVTTTQAQAEAEPEEQGGGGKKKKQQKGGFVRDGTRAMLMGDPYPKAS
jgi:hypothetical protein